MKHVKLIDCTLRDGGYINDWEFGHSAITCIFERLVNANVDIIEVGFLDDRRHFDIDRTIQPETVGFDRIFDRFDKKNTLVVAMIDYGTCRIENIAPCSESFIDGIRIIFKKPNMKGAVEYAEEVIAKGYAVSMQLVSITSYSDRDILDLVEMLNRIHPYAVTMVDTYGLMHKEEMLHYFNLLDYNLTEDISIGYHSHNNFQLAYANAVELLKIPINRTLLIDGTVYGMGKSAGNAPLELLAMHLNENYSGNYDLDHILEIIDVNIMRIYREHHWGYSLLYFLAASNDCHPNYINYLLKKKTLSVHAINDIVKLIDENFKLNYNQKHIEELYLKYQRHTIYENGAKVRLKSVLTGRKILLLGPGKSITIELEKIKAYIEQYNPVVISTNCIPSKFKINYVFICNSKRYSMLFVAFKQIENSSKIIATSNVSSVGKPFDFVIDYATLRDENNIIEDNALIMLLNLMRSVECTEVVLAGFDGFSEQAVENYYDEYMELSADYDRLMQVNQIVAEKLIEYKKDINIQFLTNSLYEGAY